MIPDLPGLEALLTAVVQSLLLHALRLVPALALPVFGGLRASPTVRSGVLAVLVLATWSGPLAVPLGSAELVEVAAAQLALGLLAALPALVLFEAARTAGAVADQALGRGSFGGGDVGPVQPGAPMATLYALAFLAVFTAAGGHIAIVAGLGLGLEAVPLTAGFEALTSVVSLPAAVQASLVLALATVAPVVAAALTVDLALGAMQRALPRLPVLFLAMPLRTWAGLIVVVGTLTTFGPALTSAVIEALP